ncbi:hypothetical protein [Streptomyces sp. NPDC006551]|uniref:hypothetical protein n=1 Tax=Streptomyces sp. NPDC006551 TaxID=3157178 RepID=UPI0033AFCBBD
MHVGRPADAGLTRARVMMAAGLVVAALFGFGVTGWYDRKGPHRIPVEPEPEETAVLAAPGVPAAHGNRSVYISSESG